MTEGWRWRMLGDICVQDRVIVDPDSARARELTYLSLEHIESTTGRILKTPSEPSGEEGRSTTFFFDARHVLYGKLRPYLNKVALPDFPGRCTTELIPLLPCPGISREFLAWLLRRPDTVQAAMQEKTGARMPRADMKHVLSLKVPVPDSLSEQQQLAVEITARLDMAAQARKLLQEQEELLTAYIQRTLADFPCQDVSS